MKLCVNSLEVLDRRIVCWCSISHYFEEFSVKLVGTSHKPVPVNDVYAISRTGIGQLPSFGGEPGAYQVTGNALAKIRIGGPFDVSPQEVYIVFELSVMVSVARSTGAF